MPNPLKQLNDEIVERLRNPGPFYWVLLAIAAALMAAGGYIWYRLLQTGIGIWGLQRPSGWGIDITTFVFWVGITHSGTLISAIFYLLGAPWRAAISRIAEAMTVFAIMTAGIFPIMHLGRAWFFYWLFPYPNERHLVVNFRSPLIWDVFAIATYFTVSGLFWYLGMIPDFAMLRDRGSGGKRTIYSFFAAHWRGTAEQWRHFGTAYRILASLTIPLAVSVHSVVSWDFAMGILPGWHSTIFAPYFVAGAIFSGLAMLCTLAIPLRKGFRLEKFITHEHFEKLAYLLVLMSLIMSYCYACEFFAAWYSEDPFEMAAFEYRAFGAYAALFWIMILCNCAIPMLLLFKPIRRTLPALFSISVLINLGMYLERFIIVPVTLAHDFDPYIWRVYRPTIYEYGVLAGSFGFFLFWFLLFLRVVPAMPTYELRELARAHSHSPARGANL